MNKKQKLIFLIFSIIIVIIIAIISKNYNPSSEKRKKKKEESILKKVPVLEVENTKKAIKISLMGRVKSKRELSITAEVNGILKEGEIILKEGTNFSKGQTLFKVDNKNNSLALGARKSSFIKSLAALLSDIQVDFKEELPKWQSYLSKVEIDSPLPKIPSFSNNKEKIFLASKNILTEYYTILSEENMVQKSKYLAPFSGVITKVATQVGSPVNAGVKVIEIIDNKQLEMVVFLQEKHLKFVEKKQEVIIIKGTDSIKSKVVRFGEVLDQKTQSIPIYIDISSAKKLKIFSGMYLEVVVVGKEQGKVFEIPRRALTQEKQVYVVENKKLSKQKVELVFSGKNSCMIKGLANGKMVVVAPLINVFEGMEVEMVKQL